MTFEEFADMLIAATQAESDAKWAQGDILLRGIDEGLAASTGGIRAFGEAARRAERDGHNRV